MRLLCTGDIHLGRNPTRIPTERVPDQTRFSTRAIWKRIVSLAIEESVDGLLISGDLVDYENRYFEALGPVEEGIERLREAGIPVFAVAGNHDFDVLPRLADRFGDALRLLGRNQRWERFTLRDDTGRARLHIDGWSFGTQHVLVDPLATYALPAPADAPAVGLLHCDLDQSGSRYAPVRLSDLRTSPVCAWLIGHNHAPVCHRDPGGPPVLYPGSPVPLDPGEHGEHGVWMLDIDSSGVATYSFRSISPLCYQRVSIDLTGAVDATEAGDRIFKTLNTRAQNSGIRYQLFRVDLTGRTRLGLERHARFDEVRTQQHADAWSIETLIDRTRPEVDLHALAHDSSPPGLIARLLQSLDQPESSGALLAAARTQIDTIHTGSIYNRIRDIDPPNERELLESTAWELLEALLAQREVAQ